MTPPVNRSRAGRRVVRQSGRRAIVALIAGAALANASCAAEGEGSANLQSLDRPTDVAFGCYGLLYGRVGLTKPYLDQHNVLGLAYEQACCTWLVDPYYGVFHHDNYLGVTGPYLPENCCSLYYV